MMAIFNKFDTKVLPHLLSLLLVMATMPQAGSLAMAQEQLAAPASSSGYTGQGAPLTIEELQSLVAPIALYPDAVVAQILVCRHVPRPNRRS